ncbi:MAG: EAL domain-containing protein, partial [Muribaculaceae bacterium]|nr:EAL domain-containing protein [Muribaculaceae bacterium]
DDFHYVKIQIERLRELGFKVWLDGYGSGHLSPEMLQKIGFDLFELDMSYVTQMDKTKKSRGVMT